MSDTTPRVPISKRLVLLNGAASTGTRIIQLFVYGWALRELVRQVPEDELAVLPVVLSVSFLAPTLRSVLMSGLARFVTEAYAQHDDKRVTEIVSSLFPFLALLALGFLAISGIVAWQVEWLLSIEADYVGKARLMLMLIGFRIALTVVLAAHSCGVDAAQAFVRKSQIQILGSLLQVVLLASLIIGIGPEVEFIVIGQTAASMFVAVVTCLLSMRLLPMLRFRRSAFNGQVAREVIQYGGWYSMQQLAATIRRAADLPILKRFATSVDVTTMFLGVFIEDGIRQFINSASQPLMPALTAMHAASQKSRLHSAYLRGGRISCWVSLLIATPLFVFSDDLVRLYLGAEHAIYPDTSIVVRLMLLGFITTYPSRLIYSISAATGSVRRVALAAMSIALINLVTTLILVCVFGMGAIGSAISTAAAFLIFHPVLVWPIAIQRLGVSWSEFFRQILVPGLSPAFVASIVGFAYQLILPEPSLFRCVTGGIVCVIAYVSFLAVAAQQSDRKDFRALLDRFRRGPKTKGVEEGSSDSE